MFECMKQIVYDGDRATITFLSDGTVKIGGIPFTIKAGSVLEGQRQNADLVFEAKP